MTTKKIETAGQLREFLSAVLVDVVGGKVDGDTARNVVKLAAQVNESFYSEIKIGQVRNELAGEELPKIGQLPINSED